MAGWKIKYNKEMKNNDWPKLAVSVLMTEAAGIIGAMATTSKIGSWYRLLNKPFLAHQTGYSDQCGQVFIFLWGWLFIYGGKPIKARQK